MPDLTLLFRRMEEGVVLVKVVFSERVLRQQVKKREEYGTRTSSAWELRYDRALALGLRERILEDTSCYI